ncbi:hypothetical protein PINS_up001954 [Pythium insidiosum]|nr:hypothetical protein PINS_up001954 [Pythium insidiosum]
MFSARKVPEPSASANVKRASPLWSMFGSDGALDGDAAVDARRAPFSPSSRAHLQQAMQPKRQRLEGGSNRHVKTPLLATQSNHRHREPVRRAPSLGDIENDDILVETQDCTVTRVQGVPNFLVDELRRGEDTRNGDVVVNCRIAVPSPSRSAGERRVLISYYVLMLRERLVLWQEDSANVVSLSLPEELHADVRLFPFLFALYGSRISLMVVASNGLVLFWEDINLPYESVPLSVQIPLQLNEEVTTHGNASLVIAAVTSPGHLTNANDQEGENDDLDEEFTTVKAGSSEVEMRSIFCWSNQGNVWEIAMEDRRIRARAFERQQSGFLSGLSKTVSQFFFASAPTSELALNGPIQSVKILSTSAAESENMACGDERDVDMLVLYEHGALERRSFNASDVMDCTYRTRWQFDANRVAIAYFSEHFPSFHLAKVFMVSVPYIVQDGFGLLVAYVCTSGEKNSAPTVKYAMLHFSSSLGESFQSSRVQATPEPEWACLLDYEPRFSELSDTRTYVTVECFPITSSSLYLVWTRGQPVHITSIQLPKSGQTIVHSRGFSLQGVRKGGAVGFGSQVDVVPRNSTSTKDLVKGSVTFLLLDIDQRPGGIVCAATTSTMTRLDQDEWRAVATGQSSSLHVGQNPSSDATSPYSYVLGENLDVNEYARLLLSHSLEFSSMKMRAVSLRVRESDIQKVAQATVAAVYQILDAKASSGLRWGKDAEGYSLSDSTSLDRNHNTVITPKLVRYQLEEKRARFETFISFIQRSSHSVWSCIESSEELMEYLIEGEEKLHAAVALCKYQASLLANPGEIHEANGDDIADQEVDDENITNSVDRRLNGNLLLRAIERTVASRGYEREQLRLAGYNAFDIFYCEISKIGELFAALAVEIQQLAADAGENNSNYFYGLLESGYSMQSLLKSPTSTQLSSNGRWMFTRTIREVVADQISRLSAAVGYTARPVETPTPRNPDEVFELCSMIRKLGSNLLDAYCRFMASNSESADDLTKEAEITKQLVLNALVFVSCNYEFRHRVPQSSDIIDTWQLNRRQDDLFAVCVKMAEKYVYYEAMVYLCFREDEVNLRYVDYILGRVEKSPAAKRLELYARKYPDFTDFLLRWYGGEARYPWYFEGEVAQSRMFAFLISNSAVFGPSLHSYMKDHPRLTHFSWLTATSSGKLDHVSSLTLYEAKMENQSLAKRKTMTSISRIAALAATPSEQVHANLEDSSREVSCVTLRLDVL